MEINKYQDITGVVTEEAIPEGRLVLVIDSDETHDFGSREDLKGVKLPDDSTEATRARYCVTFAVDNVQTPFYVPQPSFDYALRQGFDQAENVPFNADVHLTHRSVKEGLTIPSGDLALAFGPGEFTVPSGDFIADANLVPGAFIVAANATDDSEADAGKPKYSATATPIEVVRYDTENEKLTFRILY